MRKIAFALLPLALAGCMGGAGIQSTRADVDYGVPISQSECQRIAMNHIKPYLQRPSTAQFRWGACRQNTLSAKPLQGLPRQSGYSIDVAVNAQNRWGSYTGFKDYELLIHDGSVVRRLREGQRPGTMETY